MAVLTFQIRGQGDDLSGMDVNGEGIAAFFLEFHQDRLSAQGGLGAPYLSHQILGHKLLYDIGYGCLCQVQLLGQGSAGNGRIVYDILQDQTPVVVSYHFLVCDCHKDPP